MLSLKMSQVDKIAGVLCAQENSELRQTLKEMTRIPAFQPLLKFLEARVDLNLYVTDEELRIYGTLQQTGCLDDHNNISKSLTLEQSQGPGDQAKLSASDELQLIKYQISQVTKKVEEVEQIYDYLTKQLSEQEARLQADLPSNDLLKNQQHEHETARSEFKRNLNQAEACVDRLAHNLGASESQLRSSLLLEKFVDSIAALQSRLVDTRNKVVSAPEGDLEDFNSTEFVSTELNRVVNTLIPIEKQILNAEAKIFACDSDGVQGNFSEPAEEMIEQAVASRVQATLRQHLTSVMKDILSRQEATIEDLTALNKSATTLRLSCDTLRFMMGEELTCIKLWRSLLDDYQRLLEQFNATLKSNIWHLNWAEKTKRPQKLQPSNDLSEPKTETIDTEIKNTSAIVAKTLNATDEMCEIAHRLHCLIFSTTHRDQIERTRVAMNETVKRWKELNAKIEEVERQYEERKTFVDNTPYQLQKDRFWVDFIENRSKLVEAVEKLEKNADNLKKFYSLKMEKEGFKDMYGDFA